MSTNRALLAMGIAILTLLGAGAVAEETAGAAETTLSEAAKPDVVPPQIILKTQKPPEFPPVAQAARMGATVTVKAVVLDSGAVGKVEVLNCSRPNLGFEQASIAAVKQWRFEPATKDGEPVEWVRSFRLNFRVDGAVSSGAVSGSSGEGYAAEPGRAASGRSAPGGLRPR